MSAPATGAATIATAPPVSAPGAPQAAGIQRTFHHYCMLLLGQGGAMVCMFINTTLMTRLLGPGGYGHVALFIMVVQAIFTTMAAWLNTSITRYGCEEFVQQQTLRRTVGARLAVLSPLILLVVAGTLVYRTALSRYLGIPAWAVWLVNAAVVGSMALTTVQSLLQAKSAITGYAWLLLIERASILAGLLLLRAFSGVNVLLGCLVLVTLGPWCAVIIGWRMLAWHEWWPLRMDRPWVVRMLRFSAPFILSMIAVTVVTWTDVALTNHFVSKAALGTYALSRQIAMMLKQGTILGGVLVVPLVFQWMAAGQSARMVRYVERLLPLGILVWCSLVAVTLPVVWWLLPMIWGIGFAPAAWPWALLAVEVGVSAWYYWGIPVLSAYEASGQITLISILSAVLVPALGWWWIPRYGIMGSAAAVLGASVGGQLLLLYYLQRRGPVRWLRCALAVTPVIVSAGLCLWFGPWIAIMGTCGWLVCLIRQLTRRRAWLDHDDLMLLRAINLPEWMRWSFQQMNAWMARRAPVT